MITDDERANMGAALTTGVRKGPKDAVIREADATSLDQAFAEAGGGSEKDVPGAGSVRGPGGRGSIAGIRVGSKEAGGGPDVRAAENMRQRRERASRNAANAKGTNIPPQGAPRASINPTQPGPAILEPWEAEARLPPDPCKVLPFKEAPDGPLTYTRDSAPIGPARGEEGDMLNRAYRRALSTLAGLPQGVELFVGQGLAPEGVELVMGLGLLVGKGFAAYRGDGHYRITDAGWQQHCRETQ